MMKRNSLQTRHETNENICRDMNFLGSFPYVPSLWVSSQMFVEEDRREAGSWKMPGEEFPSSLSKEATHNVFVIYHRLQTQDKSSDSWRNCTWWLSLRIFIFSLSLLFVLSLPPSLSFVEGWIQQVRLTLYLFKIFWPTWSSPSKERVNPITQEAEAEGGQVHSSLYQE